MPTKCKILGLEAGRASRKKIWLLAFYFEIERHNALIRARDGSVNRCDKALFVRVRYRERQYMEEVLCGDVLAVV